MSNRKVGGKTGPDISKRLSRVVRSTLFFLIVGFMTAYATNSYSQNLTYKLNMKAVSIKDVCAEIEKKSNYNFVFSGNADKVLNKKVNVSIESDNVEEVLNEALVGTNLTYRIIDNQVVVYEEVKSETIKTPVENRTFNATQQQPVINQTISGVVVDKAGVSLPGVNIYLKSDKKIASISNLDGEFRIVVPAKNDALVFTFLGMKNVERAITAEMNNQSFRIVMEAQEQELGEVIVTGIFNKARESYTGAATSITSEELFEAGNRSLLTSIQNIDPAFNILQDITIGSDPNALPSVTIRGSSSLPTDVRDLQEDNKNLRAANQPLFIMDGFEISLARFMDLDENQVESITLLKDNSATSLYGSRGANGVVVISTKRPQAGKLMLTYRGSMNIEAPSLSSYNLLNAREKLEYEKSAGLYSNKDARLEIDLLDLYNQRKIDAERGVDTYWLKYPVRVGVGNKHSLRLEGGEEGVRYAVGLAYNNIKGAMKGSERNTFNGNVFLQYKVNNLIFQNDLQISSTKAYNSPYGTFQDFAKINSYWTPYNESGVVQKLLEDYNYTSMGFRNKIYNPLYDALLPQKNDDKYLQITNNFSLEWRFTDDLFLRGRLSLTNQTNRSDQYISSKATMFDNFVGDDLNRRGRYIYGTGESFSYEGDLTLNYSKLLRDKHLISTGVGYTIGENRDENYVITAEGITNVNMDFLGMASQYLKDGSPVGLEGTIRRVGLVFTGNYTYNNRYFIDVSARGEGSSRFGYNNRFAPFWSTGIGWNMHQENFLRGNDIVNTARLRMSYGTSGSQSFSPYQAMTTFRDYGGGNYRSWNGVYLLGLGNNDLGWQSTRQYNIGTELEFFNRYLRVNFDVYSKVTDNLLADVNLPSSSGFSSYKANVGKVLNEGFEGTINAFLIRNLEHGFSWSVGGSMIHNRNKIMEISNSLEYLNNKLLEESNINPSFMFKEGESIHTIYAVRSKGIDPSNGREIYIKQDGSETYNWDAKDKVAVGVGLPKYQGNLNTNLRYKGLALNVIFAYRYGGQMYNHTLVNKVENIYPFDNADKRVLYDRWKNPGDKAFFKSVTDRTTTNATSRFVMDENTLQLRNISLSYEVPREWAKKNLGLEYLSFTGNSEDLFYLSTVKQERGLLYPYSKKYSLSVTVRF